MKKIILCGLIAEDNLGCPSLLLGMGELLKGSYEVVNIQKGRKPKNSKEVADFPFETKYFDYNVKKLISSLFLKKFFKSKKADTVETQLLKELQSADLVVDLYGICFCDANSYPTSYLKNLKATVGRFVLPFCAKKLGVKTLKNTASYGPMKHKESAVSAQIADKHIFDCFIAREKKALQLMQEVAGIKKPIFLSPDTANLMPAPMPALENEKAVLISVSHQIIRQWKKSGSDNENYCNIIARLCEKIVVEKNSKVQLLPNELFANEYDDLAVAKEIQALLKEKNIFVDVIDTRGFSALQVKECIASAEVVIASRYHSCVAALSAGVPLLVLGWHNKYEELLQRYGQSKWGLSTENCTFETLHSKFEDFYAQRDTIRQEIKEKRPVVQEEVRHTFSLALHELGV